MENILTSLSSLLPEGIDIPSVLKFILLVAVGSLVLGLTARLLLGKHSNLNESVCSAIGILFVYALTIVIYTFNPAGLATYLAPLPFVGFEGESLQIFSFAGAAFPVICGELLSVVILAFIANLVDTVMPEGKSVFIWFLLRILTILIAFIIHILISKALEAALSGVIMEYAPMILLCILLFMLFLGLLKGVLALVLATVHPVIGAVSAFFFGNLIGVQLRKAVTTSAMISGVAYALVHYGVGTICISAAALLSYIPLIAVLLALWYFIDKIL
ncbi:MAG: hypothetical protein IKJ99_06595 [Oscillospiraceae bacterium]|nr:hypothetical protein [Oscillospiraceae bacterium]